MAVGLNYKREPSPDENLEKEKRLMTAFDNRRSSGMQYKEPLMKHSVALVTGTTSGLGYASASMLAAEGCRQVVVTGRSLSRVQETPSQLAAETKTQVFTPLELELGSTTSVQSALAELCQARSTDRFSSAQCGDGPR